MQVREEQLKLRGLIKESSEVCAQLLFFFFQAEDGIRDYKVTGVQTCALPIYISRANCRAFCVILFQPVMGIITIGFFISSRVKGWSSAISSSINRYCRRMAFIDRKSVV